MKTIISLISVALSSINIVYASDALAPPGINENTRGTPTEYDNISKTQKSSTQNNNQNSSEEKTLETKHTNAKGYTYGLEIGHSNSNVQYLEDSDRDGQIQKKTNAMNEVTELPKWKLGSW